jgi:hypothetical protein
MNVPSAKASTKNSKSNKAIDFSAILFTAPFVLKMRYLHNFIEPITLCVGLWVSFLLLQRRKTSPMLVIVVVVFLGVISDTVSWILANSDKNNWFAWQTYTLCETVLLILFMQRIMANNARRGKEKYLTWSSLGVILVWSTVNIMSDYFGQYAPQLGGAMGGILVFVSVWTLATLVLNTSSSLLFTLPETWFIIGIMIYHTATAMLFASVPLFPKETWGILRIVYSILQGTGSVVKHSCYIYGFLLCRKKLLLYRLPQTG